MSDGLANNARARYTQLYDGLFDAYCNEHGLSATDAALLFHLIQRADWRSGVVESFTFIGLADALRLGKSNGRRTARRSLDRLRTVGAVDYTDPQRSPGRTGAITVLVYNELVHVPRRNASARSAGEQGGERAMSARSPDNRTRDERAFTGNRTRDERAFTGNRTRDERAFTSESPQVSGPISAPKTTDEDRTTPPQDAQQEEESSDSIDTETDRLRLTIIDRHGGFLDGRPAQKLRRLVETHGSAPLLAALAVAPSNYLPPRVVDHLALAVLDPLELATPTAARTTIDHSACPQCSGTCWVETEEGRSVVQCPEWLAEVDSTRSELSA